MNKFCNIAFILVLMILFSCSNLDKTSDLGKNIINGIAPDTLASGIYETIMLSQSMRSYGSIRDTLRHNSSPWAIGHWGNDTNMLRLRHYRTGSADDRISYILHELTRDTTVIIDSIKAELLWSNVTDINSFDDVNVEVGSVFRDTAYFALNFALIKPKMTTNLIPLNIESYLLYDSLQTKAPHEGATDSLVTDSVFISRFDATFTNFVDTVWIDSIFRKRDGEDWKYMPNDPLSKTRTKVDSAFLKPEKYKRFTSDTLVEWRHFIPAALFDSIVDMREDTITGSSLKTIEQSFKLKRDTILVATIKRNVTIETWGSFDPDTSKTWLEKGWIKSGDELLHKRITDTLLIKYADTVIYRSNRGSYSPYSGNYANDSAVWHKKFMCAIGTDSNPIADTLIQIGNEYITALKAPKREIRTVGNIENLSKSRLLADTLDLYLRINGMNRDNILHIGSPVLRISYVKKNNPETRIFTNIDFTKIYSTVKSKDVLKNNTPVIAGALQRVVKIDLNIKDFWKKVYTERFLNIGMANLNLRLAKNDFPTQYGDSIPIYAVVSKDTLTPTELFTLPNTRRVNVANVNRDSNSVTIPLSGTLMDYMYINEVFKDKQYESSAPPKTFLYLWIENYVGRIYFDEKADSIGFTYILQTRKGGE